MTVDRERDTLTRGTTPRRQLMAAAALAPVLAGAGAGIARADSGGMSSGGGLLQPLPTVESDWSDVATALGRPGGIRRKMLYHTDFTRRDLRVVSYGITITPAFALGTHVAFVRYSDDSTLLMGDLVVTERELQRVSDALHSHGIAQTAIHKHLLSQTPDIWWTHVHAHGHDPVALARGIKAAIDCTTTPPPPPESEPDEPAVDLDTAAIDDAMGTPGIDSEGVYKCIFLRRETMNHDGRVLPPGLGATTALNFQPLGGGKAVLNGDIAMIGSEVQNVLVALRKGGIGLVTLHNHGLMDEPRLFFFHVWAVGDAVQIAKALRPAVDATDAVAVGSQGSGGPQREV
ncbi:DUF1259 domain-containing protein [Streptomyces sp. NBC_01803]|uniref:DUF1259 domain-containing protein n=1 Tax=Streptomyces sp. NBC_01803 TaxID=2975946 RepID=UPI002DDA7DF1|nr:DUF1259 domain-containing protein [Streptomyces sp. NBC_01803]WSA44740.1 DUF1259 domain-containing protein [Streptomyces sp. NBC_01803]